MKPGPPAAFNPNGWAVTAFQAVLSVIVGAFQPSGQAQDRFADVLIAAVPIRRATVAAIAGGYSERGGVLRQSLRTG